MMIQIVGLGTGEESQLSQAAWRVLEESKQIYVRTMDHPVCAWLVQQGVELQSFDSIYEEETTFEGVYAKIVRILLHEAETGKPIVYAVPGHPMVAEETVRLLLEHAKNSDIEVKLITGESFLDTVFTRLGFDPVDGFQLLDGPRLKAAFIQPRLHVLIGQVYDRNMASDVKLTLMQKYPDDHDVIFADKLGFSQGEQILTMKLYELDQHDGFSNHSVVYVAPTEANGVLRKDFDRLKDIVATLRSPQGCPWDREQTHLSLRRHLIEEAYEVIAALEQDDPDAICEELGDLLLQVMLHSQIEAETGVFTVDDVIGQLNDKLIRRHPHVFGETRASDAEDAIRHWEAMKAAEKAVQPDPNESKSIWDLMPQEMPALLLAAESHKKIGKAIVATKLQPLAKQLEQLEFDATDSETQIAKLLEATVWLAKSKGVDPEHALRDLIRSQTQIRG